MERNHNFYLATRAKLRFETAKGEITTEDLWDLSLTSLDNIARAVNRKIKETEDSFLGKKTAADSELELKLEILKEVISTKQSEAEAKADAIKRKQEIEQLEDLLQSKKTDALKDLTPEQIQERINALKQPAS